MVPAEVAIVFDSLSALASVNERPISITAPSEDVTSLSVKLIRSVAVAASCNVIWLISIVLENIGFEKINVSVAVPKCKSKASNSGSEVSGTTS